MELKQIKEMMAAMTRHGTKRLVIKRKEFELELERECTSRPEVVMMSPQTKPLDIPQSLTPPAPFASKPEEDTSSKYVTSPMVGTFYITPAPDEPPLIKAGDRVDQGTVICIVEAMKVMNEIKAGISGTITEVLVENGHPVEFGTKLFKVS